MNKYLKYLFMMSLMLVVVFMTSCKKDIEDEHECIAGKWEYPDEIICEQEYQMVQKCTVCDKVLDTVTEYQEHELYDDVVDATCTSDGQIIEKCLNCDYEDVTIIQAHGHNINDEVVDSTCEEDGYVEHTCANCDYYQKDILEKTDHDLEVVTVDATCEEDGYVEHTCANCDYYQKEIIEAQGHSIVTNTVDPKCNYNGYTEYTCEHCDYYKKENIQAIGHDYIYDIVEVTCTTDGHYKESCARCDYVWEKTTKATGHTVGETVIERDATDELYGIKHKMCSTCGGICDTIEFVNNGFSHHGKLSVVGPDLVDQYGEKFQLIGLSTHGLQWAGKYVNYDTFEALRDTFGMNVIRLSLYTAENGYCTGTPTQKEKLYNLVVSGIEYATALDMYVIIDWHMLGAESEGDENPLYYVKESMEFFDKITKQFPDNDNLLYEIMNEPSGATTWQDCKDYANQVIPVIRANSDGVVLVGNPKWSADLNSVMKSPLTGYENIMYTYHFYAADHFNTTQVITAYDSGYPVFITEHGGMESSGDGDINYDSIANWHSILNARNISYVAWNISNTKGSASILKTTSLSLTEFNKTTMKAWGVYYCIKVRLRFGLPTL